MEESLKNRLILILVILAVIFFMGTMRSCGAARKLKLTTLELDKEKAMSWDMEQKSNELKKEKAILEKELEENKASLEVTKKALLQEQLVNQSLKEELQKVTKLKEKLEEDLKEALVASKKSKK
jgi:hypothetical protein